MNHEVASGLRRARVARLVRIARKRFWGYDELRDAAAQFGVSAETARSYADQAFERMFGLGHRCCRCGSRYPTPDILAAHMRVRHEQVVLEVAA